jgi:hypothetical protein
MYGNEDKFFEIFETGPTQICADLNFLRKSVINLFKIWNKLAIINKQQVTIMCFKLK